MIVACFCGISFKVDPDATTAACPVCGEPVHIRYVSPADIAQMEAELADLLSLYGTCD